MRVAHVTDIHVQVRPRLAECFNKRFLGAGNLYIAGREGHFTREVQTRLVEDVLAQKVDAIACTGDVTALATEREFEVARSLLGPLFESAPTVLIPGNHDVYTGATERDRPLESWFGEWTGEGAWPRLHRVGEVAFVCVDVCRAMAIVSSGSASADQLERLDAMLQGLDATFTFLMLHYPLRDRRGEPYGPWTRNIENAEAIEAVLARHAAQIGAILHGHEHHGFRTELPSEPPVPILNPGASGYANLPDKGRRAHFCVYTVTDGRLSDVERFAYDGERFVPEPGGPWASGG